MGTGTSNDWEKSGDGNWPAASTLVIGYGNDLRGDDGAGICVAGKIAKQSPQTRVIIIHQLTPELAGDIATASRVLFIDAYPARETGAKLRIEKISATQARSESAIGHHGDPSSLLRLADELFGAAPEAWLIGIPAFNFDLGEKFSPQTTERIDEAIETVRRFPSDGNLRCDVKRK